MFRINFDNEYVLSSSGITQVKHINNVDLTQIENGIAAFTVNGSTNISYITGIGALELVWMLKPSALEGKQLTWPKHSWIVHNLIAHPLMQLLAFVGMYKWAMTVHDRTVPKPIGLKPCKKD